MTNLLLAFLLLTNISSVYLSFTNDPSNESSNASTDDKSSVAATYENCFVWFMEGQCLEKIEECPTICNICCHWSRIKLFESGLKNGFRILADKLINYANESREIDKESLPSNQTTKNDADEKKADEQ